MVGAGVTGSEAAWRLAHQGVPTQLVTTSLDTVAALPRDAWRFEVPPGGLLERLAPEASEAGLWSGRALRRGAKRELERLAALHLVQSTVVDVLRDAAGSVVGVSTWEGVERHAPFVALCVGSFLHARLTVGASEQRAGRLSELADDALFEALSALGLRLTERRLELQGDAERPGYTVRHAVLAPGETSPDGALVSLPGLYAFGLCAGGDADLSAAAAAGAEAADVLLAALSERR